MVVGVGCVLALALIDFGVTVAVNRLDWVLYPLVRDLRWVAFLLWAGLLVWTWLAATSDAVQRIGVALGRVLVGPPWSRTLRWVWVVLVALAATSVLLADVVSSSPRGVSRRVGRAWRSTAPDVVPPKLVPRFAFRGVTGVVPERPLGVVMSGWAYAPLSGRYEIELTSLGDALVEVDGKPLVGLGNHGAVLEIPWATDPSGARRVSNGLSEGFHQVTLFYRPTADQTRLVLRWIPPYGTTPRHIPVQYLLPEGTSLETLRWRHLALAGRRLGIALLVFLLTVGLASFIMAGPGRRYPRPGVPSNHPPPPAGRGLTRDGDPSRA